MLPKPFRFTYFRKNASVTPLVSHTFKTKDLKPFRFTHFQKKGGGYPWGFPSDFRLLTSSPRFSLTPLDSALTSKRAPKSFTSNTYEKHTRGEGVHLLSTVNCQLTGFLYLINLLHPPLPPAYASSLSAVSISERAWSSPFFLATAIPLERISRASPVRASFASNWPKWK